jgi:hypothetical protein
MLENQIGEMSDDIKNSYAEFFGDMVDSEWGNDKMDEKYELFGLFSKEGKVKRICRTYGIRNYTINSDGSIDIDGNVDLTYKISEKLLLKFGNVSGSFYCDNNPIWYVWDLFRDHTKFEFFNDCDPIRENRVIILERLNFFLDYIGYSTVTGVKGYKCI